VLLKGNLSAASGLGQWHGCAIVVREDALPEKRLRPTTGGEGFALLVITPEADPHQNME
jgi:hypothetical protein